MEDVVADPRGSLERVIGLLRASYTHLILDLSKSFHADRHDGLRMSDVILLVAQLELTSLRNVVRMLLTLEQGRRPGRQDQDRPQPRRHRDSDITLKKAEETIGKPDLLADSQRLQGDDRRAQQRRAAADARPARARCSRASQGLANALTGKDARRAGQEGAVAGLFSFK